MNITSAKLIVIIIAAIVVGAAISQYTGYLVPNTEPDNIPEPIPPLPKEPSDIEPAVVSEVVDGDTVRLQSGETVRLLGINTPEKGQSYFEESTDKLKEFVSGKPITLEKDVSDKDQYGRLLRYIYVEDIFVNMELVRQGYANAYIISPNTKYSNLFIESENQAKSRKIGIWEPRTVYPDCIGILYFHWNAEGNDNYNLNDEYVTFRNSCSLSIDMTGFTIKDEATHIDAFPEFELSSQGSVTLHTGSGTNTHTDFYWGRSGGQSGAAVWNNNGDTLYMRDKEGNLVISYTYNITSP